MQVVATAGHVDHGKSTLVRALTGMEPDRLAEERRRGLTLDLGFAWMTLPSGERLAFVDVPGHGRFVTTMLAGVGPVPAVVFVVAADEGWMPQSAEHLAAIDALGVRHGLLVVTRADLADPALALAQAPGGDRPDQPRRRRGGRGEQPDRRRDSTGSWTALDDLVARLPDPDPAAPVRLWLDRSFTIKGSGTIVTGTLPAGRVRVGDSLELAPAAQRVRVRALQSLKEPAQEVTGVARVALNIRGVERAEVVRGMALIAPDQWTLTDTIDVRLRGAAAGELPRELTFHIGSAAVPARVRPFGARRRAHRPDPPRHAAAAARRRPRAAARPGTAPDPGRRHRAGRPPARRCAAAVRARPAPTSSPAGRTGPTPTVLLRQHGVLRVAELRAMGCSPTAAPVAADWVADPDWWAGLGRRLAEAVERHASRHPARPRPAGGDGPAGARAARPPTRRGARPAAAAPRRGARLRRPARRRPSAGGGRRRGERCAPNSRLAPYRVPDAGRLARARARAQGDSPPPCGPGRWCASPTASCCCPAPTRPPPPSSPALPQPFTASEARQALDTTRRVVIPLLEHLDRLGYTERVDETRRRCRRPVRPVTP